MYGIALSEQEYCSVSGNTITNSDVGITLDAISDYNSINGNTMANNSVGIGVAQASNNTFCHNNLVNNTQQAEFERPLEYTNFWDNGCEGNYWSDYTGTDLDNDGVGDTYLPWETVDNYPLMNIYWNPCDINHDLKVDMRDIGLSAKAFGTSPGDMLWNPHADITSREPNVPDAKVDMRDISLIAIHFGERYP
jgi:parallel beta-helix repeat protein